MGNFKVRLIHFDDIVEEFLQYLQGIFSSGTNNIRYNAVMTNINTPSSIKEMPLAIIKNMVMLTTSGFGVVVALAWNEAIKNAVQIYIDPFLGKNSGVISLFIYAIVMTLLAVSVTMQLARLQKTLEDVAQRASDKKKKQ